MFGAADPNSGTAIFLEIARGFGELLKMVHDSIYTGINHSLTTRIIQGWKPQRTIILCNWDGEEYGIIIPSFLIANVIFANLNLYNQDSWGLPRMLKRMRQGSHDMGTLVAFIFFFFRYSASRPLHVFSVAYLNIDVGVTGSNFSALGTPSLTPFLREATKSITDPNTGRSLFE